MWQRFVDGVEQFRAELMGQRKGPSRRNSRSDEECSISLDMQHPIAQLTQEEANLTFVREYERFIQQNSSERNMYCCMIPHGGCWWMARTHPVVAVLCNSRMKAVAHAQGGQLMAFDNQDVEDAMLEIESWFDMINNDMKCSFRCDACITML
jgi:formylglycine-generating enzyme required for sulfatase activity